ncbi:hypothetical protein OsI_20167 [Oryza sativa Indica Group]|uniref:Uncharacterized protein n=1 Tax=Oryza sativa subsp. indica TaxID=39946 RepID=A2Y5A0_ORYSI|nr:hypothetical protein OsI_20167 [Oryza sativa Indica Group]
MRRQVGSVGGRRRVAGVSGRRRVTGVSGWRRVAGRPQAASRTRFGSGCRPSNIHTEKEIDSGSGMVKHGSLSVGPQVNFISVCPYQLCATVEWKNKSVERYTGRLVKS